VTFEGAEVTPVVGLGGARGCQDVGASSASHSSKSKEAGASSASRSSKSKEWSLSDPDVRELLQQERLAEQSLEQSLVEGTPRSGGPLRMTTPEQSLTEAKVGLAVPPPLCGLSGSLEDSLALESVTSVTAELSV